MTALPPPPFLPVLSCFASPGWEATIPTEILAKTEALFGAASEQHPARKWEYAMAQLAFATWRARKQHGLSAQRLLHLLDVGGAGSPLAQMLVGPQQTVLVVDPKLASSTGSEQPDGIVHLRKATIEQVAADGYSADALFSISVLEHVPDVDAFLAACSRVLAPNGLLFLTVDAWDPPVAGAKDTAHFHWMRQRIFDREMLQGLLELLQKQGFSPLGGVDLEYRGPLVYGYTFASIARVKEG
jgi:SAM-dependent methyltransferase